MGEGKRLATRQTPTVAVLIISPLLHPRPEQEPVVNLGKRGLLHTHLGSKLDKNSLSIAVNIDRSNGLFHIFINLIVK